VEVRVSGASSVIVHRVPPDGAERFLEWQRGISAAITGLPGYQATDVYPPADGEQEWVVILHFADPEDLQRWLGSSLRAEWLAKLHGASAEFQVKTLPGGFGAWFTGLLGRPGERVPPPWKMALSVLLGLYPTVMLLAIVVGPHTNRFGLAAAMLIGNAMSVSLLQWAVMPAVQVVLGPWLRASGPRGTAVTIRGAVLILLVLVGLMLVFRAVAG
jgi:antibiotic biosynthesis monooxygenase (ABM) superfamily enzyme